MSKGNFPSSLHRAPLVGLLILAALVAAAFLVPVNRLWGINHPAYFPMAFRLAALALMVVSFVPFLGNAMYAFLVKGVSLGGDGRVSWLVIILVSLVAVGVFYGFQSASLLLGDGHVIGTTYDKALAGDMSMNTASVGKILENKHIEPGAAILYLLGAKGLTALTGGTGTEGLRLFNCLLGGLFVLTILAVVVRGGMASGLKIWLLILVLTSGAMELFFGYVEYYTPLFLCGTFYVLASWRALHRRGPVWLPVVLAGACAFIHIQGSLLLPSLAVVLVWRIRDRDTLLRPLALFLGGVTLAAFAAAYLVPRSASFMVPLLGTPESHGVLSPARALDIFNELFLLFPLWIPVAVMGLVVRRVSISPSGAEKGAPDWFSHPAAGAFSGMLLWPAFLFLVFFRPEIGMARDWDLFSILVPGLVAGSLLVVNRFLAVGGESLRSLTGPALAIAGVLAISWVGINASPLKSADRFADVLAFESSRSDYAYETLARHYQELGLFPGAIAAQREALAVSGNPRQAVNLSVMLRDAGRVAESQQLLRDLLVVNPTYWDARRILILQLMKDQDFTGSAAVAQEGIAADPKVGGYHFLYGKNMMILGRFHEAEPALREAGRLGLPAQMAAEMNRMLTALPGLRQAQDRKE